MKLVPKTYKYRVVKYFPNFREMIIFLHVKREMAVLLHVKRDAAIPPSSHGSHVKTHSPEERTSCDVGLD